MRDFNRLLPLVIVGPTLTAVACCLPVMTSDFFAGIVIGFSTFVVFLPAYWLMDKLMGQVVYFARRSKARGNCFIGISVLLLFFAIVSLTKYYFSTNSRTVLYLWIATVAFASVYTLSLAWHLARDDQRAVK